MKKIVAACVRFSASLNFTIMIFGLGCVWLLVLLFVQQFPNDTRFLFIKLPQDFSRSFIFNALVWLLCLNVCACCGRYVVRILVASSRDAQYNQKPCTFSLPVVRRITLQGGSDTADGIEKEFRRRFKGSVRKSIWDGKNVLYAERNGFAQIGFFVAHVSIVAVLIGALMAARGSTWYCDIERGQSINPLIVSDAAGNQRKLNFGIRCEDYFVEHRQGSSDVGSMWCLLSIIEHGTIRATQRIDFSSSLRFRGFDFYQQRGTSVRERARIAVTDPTGPETLVTVRNRESFLLPGSDMMLQVVSLKQNALRVRTQSTPSFVWITNDKSSFYASTREPYLLRLVDVDRAQVVRLKIVYDPGKYVLWIGACCGSAGFLFMFLFPRSRVRIICNTGNTIGDVIVEADGPRSVRFAEELADAFRVRVGVHANIRSQQMG